MPVKSILCYLNAQTVDIIFPLKMGEHLPGLQCSSPVMKENGMAVKCFFN